MPRKLLSPNHCNICCFKKLNTSDADKLTSDLNAKQLKTCAGCRLISYCSLEHQKLDWKKHMELCRAAQTILISKPIVCQDSNFIKAQYIHEFTGGRIKTHQQLIEASWKIQLILENLLKRKLYYYERDLIAFPKICPKCLSFKVNPKYKCCQCNEIIYCSSVCNTEHAQAHNKICNDLKIYYNYYDTKEINLEFSFNYNDIDMESINLFEYLQNFTKIKIPIKPKTLQEYQIFSTACNYSYVCTLLKIIRQLNLLPKADCENFLFTIFFVGARDELKYFKEHYCKFLLSQLPTIKKLKLVFIGPELRVLQDINQNYQFEFEKVKLFDDSCSSIYLEIEDKSFEKNQTLLGDEEGSDCEEIFSAKSNQSTQSSQSSPSVNTDQTETSNKINISVNHSVSSTDAETQADIQLPLIETRECIFELSKAYFEDYVDGVNLDAAFLANLVVCFNCKFNEFDGNKNTWKYAITNLLQMKRTPIAFTSTTQLESKLNMKCLFNDNNYQEKLFIILKSNEFNTMCDFRPFRNHDFSSIDEIYYQNGYISAILGKSEQLKFDYLKYSN